MPSPNVTATQPKTDKMFAHITFWLSGIQTSKILIQLITISKKIYNFVKVTQKQIVVHISPSIMQ
jgi:hypothetical protein